MIRVGPAGWSYDDWNGIVYPLDPPKGFDPLRYLSRYFDTIEVNSTFYRPTRAGYAQRWVERVAVNEDFRFTAKLWRRFTHQRGEAWSREDVRAVREGMDPLHGAGRLGALLLQFPWSFRNTEENRTWLDDLLRTFAVYPLAVEVRHASWNEDDFFRLLVEHGAGFVNIDQPQFRNSIPPSAHATASIGYVRVHGRNYDDWWRENAAPHERYDYLYSADELEPWIERVREIDRDPGTDDVYVITNNHYRGQAVANALMLGASFVGGKLPAPPDLLERYGDILAGYVDASPVGRSAA